MIVVEALALAEVKTKAAAAMLKALGRGAQDAGHRRASRTRSSRCRRATSRACEMRAEPSRVTARDVMDAQRVIATRAAVERLQEVLAS